jgi:hypothetical protein
MVILHHELEIEIEGVRERHTATLLAFGEGADIGSSLRPQSAMARTVGIPAAIAAQVNSIHISSCNYFCYFHGDSTRLQYCFEIGQIGRFTKITNFGLRKLNHFVDRVGGRYVVTLLNQTPMFEWYIAKLVVENGHRKDLYVLKIETLF